MRILYTLLLYSLMPLVVLRMLWRSRRLPGYRQRWRERFGFFDSLPGGQPVIWVHAVSVGETQAAVPMVQHLLDSHPGHRVLLTTTTPTGSRRVHDHFGDDVCHVYAPYDLPGAVRRFLDRSRPVVAIIMETEIWPNLFAACESRRVPLLLANARLSERSAAGYRRFRRLSQATLSRVSIIAAQTDDDAARFADLGVDRDRLVITGNIKFDMAPRASVHEQGEILRQQLGSERPVWIAASTHEGEEEQVLAAFLAVRNTMPDCLLILVPRHPERAQRLTVLTQRAGLGSVTRTSGMPCNRDCQVLIVDTLGELELFYAASDVAYVGGSLVQNGGHNMLEPAALGLPVISGPHTWNFQRIAESLAQVGGLECVNDQEQLAGTVERLLRNANLRHAMGEHGRDWVDRNRGALERLNRQIDRLLDSQR
jgi:3-deoxy-D-manno-octulosonic-acid transferase